VIDFGITLSEELLPVRGMEPVRGFLPVSVHLVGSGFNRTSAVRLDGIDAVEFAVRNDNSMIVRVPQTLVGSEIHTVEVLAPLGLGSKDASVSFAVTMPVRKVEGLNRLVQGFLMELFTTRGSDIFNPDSGGGIRNVVGRSGGGPAGRSVTADAVLAVGDAEKSYLRTQSANRRIPASERLAAARVSDVGFDPLKGEVSLSLEITNAEGRRARVGVS
jgi:hypothetical protein